MTVCSPAHTHTHSQQVPAPCVRSKVWLPWGRLLCGCSWLLDLWSWTCQGIGGQCWFALLLNSQGDRGWRRWRGSDICKRDDRRDAHQLSHVIPVSTHIERITIYSGIIIKKKKKLPLQYRLMATVFLLLSQFSISVWPSRVIFVSLCLLIGVPSTNWWLCISRESMREGEIFWLSSWVSWILWEREGMNGRLGLQ